MQIKEYTLEKVEICPWCGSESVYTEWFNRGERGLYCYKCNKTFVER